jgi:prolyl 4-hydroxylase
MSLFTVTQLSSNPWVWVVKDFLSDQECKHLIKLAEGKLQPSTLYSKSGTSMIDHEVRSSENTFLKVRSSENTFLKVHQDDIVTTIEDRIAKLTTIPTEFGEGLQMLNYKVGQFYKPHFDFFEPTTTDVKNFIAKYGQRITTVCMYLNTVEEGGCTFFPEIGLEMWPIKGTAFMWHNINPISGTLEFKTKHEAQPIIKGEKWMATKWYRNLPFQNIIK